MYGEIKNLSFEEKARRVLVVLYKMSNGVAGVPISKESLLVEVNRSGVMRMTSEEFEQYRSQAVTQARALRN